MATLGRAAMRLLLSMACRFDACRSRSAGPVCSLCPLVSGRGMASLARLQGTPDPETAECGNVSDHQPFSPTGNAPRGHPGCGGARKRSGRGRGFSARQRWHGHAWVEAAGYILDISGDQFGLPPTHVEPVGCGRYRAGSDTAGDAAKLTRWHLVSLAMEKWADGPAPAAVSAGSAKPRYRAG